MVTEALRFLKFLRKSLRVCGGRAFLENGFTTTENYISLHKVIASIVHERKLFL